MEKKLYHTNKHHKTQQRKHKRKHRYSTEIILCLRPVYLDDQAYCAKVSLGTVLQGKFETVVSTLQDTAEVELLAS